MGRTDGFSPLDVEKLNALYECGQEGDGNVIKIVDPECADSET